MTGTTGRELTAVGVSIFAGGFTVGVSKHFRVLAHLEETNYAVETFRANFPDVPVRVGYQSWRPETLGPVDLVYGNPPCAPWSAASYTPTKVPWRDDRRLEWIRHLFSLLGALRPRCLVWESVTQTFFHGRELVDQAVALAATLGYSSTVLLVDAQYLGVSQVRKRMLYIAHDVEVGEFTAADLSAPVPCGAVLTDDLDKRPAYSYASDNLLPLVPPGGKLVDVFDKVNNISWRPGDRVRGRPGFLVVRLDASRPAQTLVGAGIHPTEHRNLSVQEIAVLCGYPRDYKFIGGAPARQACRGVCPPVAEWLAARLARAIREGRRRDAPAAHLVDLRRPEAVTSCRLEPERGGRTMDAPQRQDLLETADAAPAVEAARAPRRGANRGVGAYIRELLSQDVATDEILRRVREAFPWSKASRADVLWNAAKMRRDGIQPLRCKDHVPARVDPEREFDTTSLRAASQGRTVHRDYAAHFFRWGFASRFIGPETTVLDVGCGVDLPLVFVLSVKVATVPKSYVGVDLGRLPRQPRRTWATYFEQFDFTARYAELGQFDVVVCYEVLEHMTVEHGRSLLAGLRACVRPGGKLLISTPVFNGRAAANHVHEYTVDEARAALVAAGFTIEARYGTFASYNDIKKVAQPSEMATLERLRVFYADDVTACFLAPLYPDASRNNVWVCT